MRRTALCGVGLILAGCFFSLADTVPSTNDASSGGSGGSAGQADSGACSQVEDAKFCSSIPKFTAPVQIIDGAGDEFCDIPAFRLDGSTAALISGTLQSPVPTVAWARVAWSEQGLHMHFHVEQSDVLPWTGNIWEGDSIEVFAKGDANLSGIYDGTNDKGAIHPIVAPPSADGSVPARAQVFHMVTDVTEMDANLYAARVIEGGYEIEIQLPWSLIEPDGPVPSQAAPIAFTWALNYRLRTDASSSDWGFQLLAGMRSAPSSSGCDPVHPACDDRTWCTPTLE